MNHVMNPHLGFIFPGQGSQTVGMLNELADYPLVQETYAAASEILGYDLWNLIQKGPDIELNQTEKTQPALLVGSVAIWRIWQSKQGTWPKLMAGHSLGEYSALVCAGAIDFGTAVKLVEMRGRFMQEAVPSGEGAMAAVVGLENDIVATLCQQASQGEIVTPANFNALGQVVVAGQTEAVHRLIQLAKDAGAKLVKLLSMSVPSHCALMQSAAKKLATYLETVTIKTPKISVIQNAEVKSYSSPETIKEALVKQLYSPVRWVETIQLFEKQAIKLVLECGAGKVLVGLNKRITDKMQALAINTSPQLQEALDLLSKTPIT